MSALRQGTAAMRGASLIIQLQDAMAQGWAASAQSKGVACRLGPPTSNSDGHSPALVPSTDTGGAAEGGGGACGAGGIQLPPHHLQAGPPDQGQRGGAGRPGGSLPAAVPACQRLHGEASGRGRCGAQRNHGGERRLRWDEGCPGREGAGCCVALLHAAWLRCCLHVACILGCGPQGRLHAAATLHASSTGTHVPHCSASIISAALSQERMAAIRREQDEAEIKECSFRPQVGLTATGVTRQLFCTQDWKHELAHARCCLPCMRVPSGTAVPRRCFGADQRQVSAHGGGAPADPAGGVQLVGDQRPCSVDVGCM